MRGVAKDPTVDLRRSTAEKALERFYASIDRNGPCHVWTGTTDQGYGRLRIPGGYIRAHRYSWRLAFGPIPDGVLVLHKCNNRACVNPAHLYLGTERDNALDAVRAGTMTNPWRGRQTCSKGHAYTPENTRIRQRGGHAWRLCVTCERARNLANWHRARERGAAWANRKRREARGKNAD